MGAIAAHLARSAEPPKRTVEVMGAAVPHRGDRVETLSKGRCGSPAPTDSATQTPSWPAR